MLEIYDVDKMCLGQKDAVGTSGLPVEEEVHRGRQLLGSPGTLPVSHREENGIPLRSRRNLIFPEIV